MKKVNWPVVVPIVLIGVLLGWLAVWRFSRASNALFLWMSGGMPVLVVLFAFMAVVAWLRRRKSSQTWALMTLDDPDAAHFIAFVYPSVRSQLGKLGWRLHGSAYLSIPTVGVRFGPADVTFWEAGAEGPTLTLASSHIKSAAVGQVSDGYRGHPAIDLELTTAHRNNRLQLNLRNVRHHNLSTEGMKEALYRVPVGPRHDADS
ncbi:hypothetical protein [Cryobacterium sp. TMT4-31]|uniref:hypothetical protein n=1 Tax=Cryobacterium sp. TMT4-31 TaxID=1259259 RepID=UPI00106A4CEE|nr:hypothetical protein [Cryobacterium sp. TMT4-31]TFC86362.1 hypothetical protein E3T19_15395 [Cryobacterium sp. TMT4-31]